MRLQLACIAGWFAAVLLCAAAPARAQEAGSTGQWGGTIEGRGNYYWERSTRVVVPEAKVTVDTPSGVRVGVGYLMDAISSASIASGSASDMVGTELRHAVTGDVGKEFDLGATQLDFTALATYSTESDYRSLIYGLISSVAFDEKNTKLSLTLTHVQDKISDNSDPSFHGHLSGWTIGPAIEQLINPVLVFTLGYQFGDLEGYLGNHYRNGLIPNKEQPPHTRLRHGVTGRLAWYLPSTSTAVHFITSLYADSWNVDAIAPELRVYQQFGPNLVLRPHYRFYGQTHANFVPPAGGYARTYTGPTTSDPKLFGMRTHTAGLAVEYRLSFLADTFLDFAKETWVDIGFDRFWSTTSFGNGIIGTAGGRLSF